MRLVLDTNVYLSAFLSKGYCSSLLETLVKTDELFASDYIFKEFSSKLEEKFSFPKEEIKEAMQLLKERVVLVKPVHVPPDLCRDIKDGAVLGTALACRAHCLISGDKDLKVLDPFKGIRILSPREFADFQTVFK